MDTVLSITPNITPNITPSITLGADVFDTGVLIEQAVDSLLRTARSEYWLDVYDYNPFTDKVLENLLVFLLVFVCLSGNCVL